MPNLASGALSAAGPLATLRERLVAGPGTLPRIRKEEVLAAAASAQRTLRELAVQARILSRLGCPPAEIETIAALRFEALDAGRAAALELAASLVSRPASVAAADVDRLRGIGLGDEEILEIVQTAALGRMLCILSAGLDPEHEAPSPEIVAAFETAAPSVSPGPPRPGPQPGPWIRTEALSPEAFPPFAVLKQALGFVPGVFRAQTLGRPALEAQIDALRPALLAEDGLGRVRRELILLAAAAAADDAYSAGLHAELLRQLGVGAETVGAVAAGRAAATASERDAVLLSLAERLSSRPAGLGEEDLAALRSAGVTDDEVRDAIVSVAFGAFLGTLAAGVGARPDFRPPREGLEERRRASSAAAAPVEDPDAALVASARTGDETAFEALLARHQARVYRTIAGMTGSAEEAEDGCQVVFLRAFRGIADFAGASLFATWLTRIAIRESLDRLRRRHPTESLDAAADDEDFRPSLVDPWVEDPERLYAREEMRRLVRRELARLPVIYRAAVMLRDIEQLSTSEAAAALELPVPTLKTRLLRGRLLLREALAVHFVEGPAERRGGGVV